MRREPRPLVDELADLLAANASVDEMLQHADVRVTQAGRRARVQRDRGRSRGRAARRRGDERQSERLNPDRDDPAPAHAPAVTPAALAASPGRRPRRRRVLSLPALRWRVSSGAMIGLVLAGAAVVVMIGLLSPPSGARPSSNGEQHRSAPSSSAPDTSGGVPIAERAATPGATSAPSTSSIFVHVLGAVAKPGLYELPTGARIADALTAAGGAGADAELASVNLARHVSDGEQVRVLARGEVASAASSGAATGTASGGASQGASAGGSPTAAKVNLNTATLEQLVTLPRIGPAIAQRIISHRERNGPFASVDDLGGVAGIGDATLAALRDLVTV